MPADDTQRIEETIQVYFDSMYDSSKSKVDRAFHPSAMITGVFGGEFTEMTREAFGDFVDIAGETAVTRVRDDYLGLTFLDTLSLVKVDEQWSIYNKLYHIEGDA